MKYTSIGKYRYSVVVAGCCLSLGSFSAFAVQTSESIPDASILKERHSNADPVSENTKLDTNQLTEIPEVNTELDDSRAEHIENANASNTEMGSPELLDENQAPLPLFDFYPVDLEAYTITPLPQLNRRPMPIELRMMESDYACMVARASAIYRLVHNALRAMVDFYERTPLVDVDVAEELAFRAHYMEDLRLTLAAIHINTNTLHTTVQEIQDAMEEAMNPDDAEDFINLENPEIRNQYPLVVFLDNLLGRLNMIGEHNVLGAVPAGWFARFGHANPHALQDDHFFRLEQNLNFMQDRLQELLTYLDARYFRLYREDLRAFWEIQLNPMAPALEHHEHLLAEAGLAVIQTDVQNQAREEAAARASFQAELERRARELVETAARRRAEGGQAEVNRTREGEDVMRTDVATARTRRRESRAPYVRPVNVQQIAPEANDDNNELEANRGINNALTFVLNQRVQFQNAYGNCRDFAFMFGDSGF